MTDVNNVFTAKEIEFKTGMYNQHIRRLIKDGKVDLIENEDYRIGRKGIYLFEDTAIEKLITYKGSSPRCKNKSEDL